MKKIVMLGCENSHVNTFLTIMKEHPDQYRDIEVIGVFSEDGAAMQQVADAFGVPVMRSYDEAVGIADGIVVTARHGGKHYPYAKPYIASGIPMFIDKPITVDEQEALDFMRECRRAGVRLTGGSCCKYAKEIADLKTKMTPDDIRGGFVRAPINMDNPYGGFFFYSQHLVEMLGELFGLYPRAVQAYRANNTVNVVFRYDHYDVIGLYTEFSYHYFVSVALGGQTLASDASIGMDCFMREFDAFCDLLRGGEQKQLYGDFIAPVAVLCAIDRSLASGKQEPVHLLEV
jgi:hypothetical protein